MLNNYFQKKFSEKSNVFNCCKFLQYLTTRELDSYICFCIQSVVVYCKVYKGNPALYGYVVGKGRSIWIAVLDNCDYSLILLQNSTSVHSLKDTGWNLPIESETLSVNFSYSSYQCIIVNWFTCTLNGSFTHVWFSVGHLENVASLSYTKFLNVDTFHKTVSTNHIH